MNKTKLICLFGLLASSGTILAQSNKFLPNSLVVEEQEFNEAVRVAHHDCYSTDLLEKFIERHPGSRFTAQALVELERAQILASGTYQYVYSEPTLTQLRPTEEPYHYFYQNQKLFNEENPDLELLRERYEQLLGLNDPKFNTEATYYLGYIDYTEGKYEDAMNRFNGLPYDPKYNETVPFYKMQILYAMGSWEEALNIINGSNREFAFLTSEQQAEVDRIKAECLAQTGNKSEALNFYTKYIDEAEKPVATSAYNCAVLAYEKGDQKLVQKALSKSVNTDIPSIKQYSYMLLGQSYMLSGETQKANMAFEQASMIDADKEVQESAAYNKAVLVHETSYSPWGDEVIQFENFLNTYPNSKYSDNISTYLTEVYMTTKNYDAALSSIRKIKKPNQRILDAKQRLLFQCGINDFVNADYVGANNNFTECLSIPTSNNSIKAQASYWRGESRYHLDFLTDAAEDYKRFNELSSSVSDDHLKAVGNYSLGYVYFKKQDFYRAAASFDKYISYPKEFGSETYYDAISRLGDCAYYNRDFVKAESYYSTVAEAGCNSTPYGLFQQAFMFGLQKRYSEKQNVLDKLIAIYPKNDYVDDAWLEKGNTSILQGENAAAINSFKYIVDNMPNSVNAPQAAVQLAMAYNNSGQVAEAQKVYEMVARKYPNTDEAATALQDLKIISTNALFTDMPKALADGDFQKVIDNYNLLSKENVDFRDLQKMQLMTSKALFAQGYTNDAMELLLEASKDVRTETGAEAKYLLSQKMFDRGDVDGALANVTAFIQEGSPYQYWLARAIILMSDISVANDDSFTATEYLKSLQSNYSGDDDIQTMINTRLSNLK